MGERIVYSTLCALEGASPESLEPLMEMARLWASHLRGPAGFDGRILLITNLPDLLVEGAELVAASIRATDRRELFLERVRQYPVITPAPGDRIMQLDLDALAVAPLDRLFEAARPGTLMAARSGLSPLHPDHAGPMLSRPARWGYRLRGWSLRRGVSACVTVCDGASWGDLMGRWAEAFASVGSGRRTPTLGDQSFLNYLFLTGGARVRRLPGSWIHHFRRPGAPLDDPAAAGATILHFPIPRKLEEMRRWSRC